MRHAVRTVLLVCGVLIGLTLGPASSIHSAIASAPQLLSSPTAGPPGTTITLTGSGFHPLEAATLYWNGTPFMPLSTSSAGTFTTRVTLSSTAPAGSRAVLVRGTSGDQASTTFTVLSASGSPPTSTPPPAPTAQLSVSPTSGAPGSRLTISGTGFGAGTVQMTWNGTLLSQLATTNGAVSLSASLASTDTPGPRTVVAYNPTTGARASTTFTVLSPSPSPPPATPPPTGGIPTSGTTSNGCAITPAQASAEQALFTLLNQHRVAVGSPPLQLNETMAVASRQHSCDMFVHQQLNHLGSDGSSPYQRISSTGITYRTAGENIGMAGGYALMSGMTVIDNAMIAEPASPGTHHWNIINPAYTQVGIGVIYAKNQVWLTEDFTG